MKERAYSACIYLSLFLLVIIFARIVDYFKNKEYTNSESRYMILLGSVFSENILAHKRTKVNIPALIFSIPVVILPCLLAGIRADTVGVDVKVYAAETFRIMSRASSITGALEWDVDLEPGYKLLAFFSSQLSHKLGAFLFMTELMIILPVYIVAYRRAPRIPVTNTILIYLLFFYCATFNIMRQSIAAGILILAYQMLEERKKLLAIALCVAALMFHSTTIVGVFIYICVVILGKKKNYHYLLMNLAMLALTVLILFFMWTTLAKVLLSNGLVPDRYNSYLNIFTGHVSTRHSYYFTLLLDDYYGFFCRFVVVALLLYYGKEAIKRNPNASIYWCSYILSFIVYAIVFIMMHSIYGMRIVWITEFSLLLMMPELMAKNLKYREVFSLRNIATISGSLMYFLGFIVFGWNGILPFRFSF